MSKVAIVAIARLENDYINEWIGHHLGIGVDHIYVYDNSSSAEEKLCGVVYEKYQDSVTIIPAYNKQQYQMPAYKEAYENYGKDYDYLIYIDIDEFIMLQQDKTIGEFVSRFPEDCECYRMNWVMYGDSDIVNRDVSSSVVKDFVKPSFNNKRNSTTKSIVKGGLEGIDFISVHYPIRNVRGVQSNLNTYYGNMINITNSLPIDKKSLNIHMVDHTFVKLNHYITKSLGEFICQKMRRPDAAWNYERNIDKDFFQYNIKTPEKMELYDNSKKVITYYYFSTRTSGVRNYENAGDYFNKILVDKLYYCMFKPINRFSPGNSCDVSFCGSILTNKGIYGAKYIVGCGFQNSNRPVNSDPNCYYAVRGRLTKERLIEKGIEVSNDIKLVDPGLMVSKIYDIGNVTKKYKIGIIPHYVDEDRIVQLYGDKYRIISMKTSDVQNLCRQIMECEMIISSSLHGIIFSHSLGVPAYHIELSKLQEGDNFKFKDYYSCYDSNPTYKTFKCEDYVIPFNNIVNYDSQNRVKSNPTKSDILKKQNDFLSVLPYRNCLNTKYTYLQTVGDVKPIEFKRQEVEVVKQPTNPNVSVIRKLREDIASGKVIKVPTMGGFVWKRVK